MADRACRLRRRAYRLPCRGPIDAHHSQEDPMTAARPAYPPQGQWTLEAFDALPEDKVKRELVDGELLVSPTGTSTHNMLGSRLAVRLEAIAPLRYALVHENEILISPTEVRRPDVMVVTAAA